MEAGRVLRGVDKGTWMPALLAPPVCVESGTQTVGAEVSVVGVQTDICKPAVFYCTLASIFLYSYSSITLQPHLRVTILFLSILCNVSYILIMY